jgi:hypothetical protein
MKVGDKVFDAHSGQFVDAGEPECDALIIQARHLQKRLNTVLARLGDLGVDCLGVSDQSGGPGYVSSGRRVSLHLNYLAVK